MQRAEVGTGLGVGIVVVVVVVAAVRDGAADAEGGGRDAGARQVELRVEGVFPDVLGAEGVGDVGFVEEDADAAGGGGCLVRAGAEEVGGELGEAGWG